MLAAQRRNRELSLLILAFIIGAGALALVAIARNTEKLNVAIPFMIILIVAYVITHIVMRRTVPQADPLLLPLAATLNVLGVAAIYRLSPEDFGPTQVTWTAVGLACFVGT